MRKKDRPLGTKSFWLALGLALLMTLALWNLVSAAAPPNNDPPPAGGRRVGLVSTTAKCVAVKAGTPESAIATVRLEWEGQVEDAFLKMAVTGSDGGHSIYVNDHFVGSAPVRPDEQPCQADTAGQYWFTTDEIRIPAEILKRGENIVTLTNDANNNDGWTAANLYLEIHGVLTGPPVDALRPAVDIPATTPTGPSVTPPDVTAAAIYATGDVTLTSTYDGWGHYVQYHAPTDAGDVPLAVGIHGMGGHSSSIMDLLSSAVQSRTWALVAPNMHSMAIPNAGDDALAWLGAQYDIIDAIEYMIDNFDIDLARIYIVGESMGGQTTTVMSTKYPDIFAAAAEWMGFTDVTDWHGELAYNESQGHNFWDLRERTERQMSADPSEYLTPAQAPFEYQRRSAMMMPLNMLLVPLKIWHDEHDLVVDFHHSQDLADVINNAKPSAVDLVMVNQACGSDPYPPIPTERPYGHCYNPDQVEMLDFLANFTLNPSPPVSLTIRSDESKPYYWLNFSQTGGDHWSEVETSYNLTTATVTAAISDTQPLTLAFNLGSTPITGRVIERSGMGLPAATYLVNGDGNNYLHNYTSGYLTVTSSATGQFVLTISALDVKASSYPTMVLGGQPVTSTITAVVKDQLGNPVPDGTSVLFSTTDGTFPNASSTYTTTLTDGQAGAILTLEPGGSQAQITAATESVTGTTSVEIIYPDLNLLVTAGQAIIYPDDTVTYTYQLTNTGDVTLTGVEIVDDNGTPGESGDDYTVCQGITLAADAATSCQRAISPTETITLTATATGQDPLSNNITDNSQSSVNVIDPAIKITITPDKTSIYSGEIVYYTYQFTNTGNSPLTALTLIDDNGTPGNINDDFEVCSGIMLASGSTQGCNRSSPLVQDTTSTATVTGQDSLGSDVASSDSVTVRVTSFRVFLPVMLKKD